MHPATYIYNSILRKAVFPIEWSRYLVVFISKAGGDKFRPISIASCMCNAMERMINCRLNWWLESERKLPNLQYGFRRNRSCIDNLSILYVKILKSFQEDSAVSAAFLDIQAAFDNVLADILVGKMVKLGISPETCRFIYNLVLARQVTCRCGEDEEVFWLYKCLPQGSVLSPILYSIYVTELDSINSQDCKLVQYADDVCIFSSISLLDQCLSLVEVAISKIINILNGLGLSLSAEKTNLCVFSREDRALRIPMVRQGARAYYRKVVSIEIQGTEMVNSNKVKFLGLNLQSDLGWSTHINHIKQRCENPIKLIKCLGHT